LRAEHEGIDCDIAYMPCRISMILNRQFSKIEIHNNSTSNTVTATAAIAEFWMILKKMSK
jgi:hypothetical protein